MPAEDIPSIQAMILEQLRDIAAEVKHIPQLQTKVAALNDDTREMAAELRTRDHVQQQAIENLKTCLADVQMEQNKMLAAIAGVSNTVNELKLALSEQGQRLASVEQQVKASFDTQLQLGRRVREIEEATEKERENAIDGDAVKQVISEVERNRPWMHGFIAFARIVLGLLGTAAGVGLLWVLGLALTGAI